MAKTRRDSYYVTKINTLTLEMPNATDTSCPGMFYNVHWQVKSKPNRSHYLLVICDTALFILCHHMRYR